MCMPAAWNQALVQLGHRQAYGDLYRATDFHHRRGDGFSQHGNCQIQPQDFFNCADCVQQCDLGGLADLDTSQASVQVSGLFIPTSTLCEITTFHSDVAGVSEKHRSPAS